ncbi:EcsC family protein [Bacillus badius]|uniref:Protein ecsC n=1 Tax=Bacillus badius TaxID=1455 RepID=A0ABR5AT39_BACBA|nr:EcsC family protein [Bacillus badius]KIL77775.1 Protein ecsC [Bacillus badius]MED4715714.1 EcsC family protein [Bacillus badius]
MTWTERDKIVWDEIMAWEQSLAEYEGNDFQYTYSKWLNTALSTIPEETLSAFFGQLDNVLFQMHSLLQGSQFQNEAKERILTSARIFREDIAALDDLKKLTIDQIRYLSSQQSSRHRFYSLLQGGITGTGGALTLSTDFAAMAVLNLRAIQMTAMTYGYDPQLPFEMMASLKVFHAAALPDRLKADGWQELLIELEERDHPYFYNEVDQLTDLTWMERPVTQLGKLLAITLFKNQKMANLPLISVAIGAGVNYRLTKRMIDFAERYYQYRWLQDKRENMKINA